MVFYVGFEKDRPPAGHDPSGLYRAVLRESIKRLDDFCDSRGGLFMMILDEQGDRGFREGIVAEASQEMFGEAGRVRMIEPPIQAESHLFQTLQCADWICGLVGRAGCHLIDPMQYADLAWLPKYFAQRLARVAPISGIQLHEGFSAADGEVSTTADEGGTTH